MIVEGGLILQPRSAVRLSQILCLNQLRQWIDGANRRHAGTNRLTLVEDGANEGPVVSRMWIPMPVEARKPSRRERLVDRSVLLDPRISLGDRGGEFGELVREFRIEKAG